MREINKISEALFEKIRDRFEDVTLGDENAKATQSPEDARFFNFDYTVDGNSHGNITISVIDENSLKVYFSKNISSDLDEEEKAKWYGFLRELREFAKRNLLSFEPRDITRSTLKHRDLQQVSKSDSTYSKDEVIGESRLHGTSRSSYEQDGNVKIIVRHSDKVDPEQRGARSRKIKALFIETADGARIKLPHNNLKYARAMAQHITQGGEAGDDFGQHITKIAEECGKLRPFKSAMVRRTFEDAETQSMAEAAFEYHGLLNNTLKKMGGRKGYAACKESFVADDVLMDEFDVDALRERFVKRSFNDRMEDALPLVQKAYNMKKSNNFAQQFESWANTISEGTWAIPDTEEQVSELTELLMEPLPVGVDAINATNALYNLIGDDTLFDNLGVLADEDSEADARDVVMDWVQENMPDIYQQIMSVIGDEDPADQTVEPELDEGTLDSGEFDSDAFNDGDLSDQQFLAKHGFTKQELYDYYPVFAANNALEREQDEQDRAKFSPGGRLADAIERFKPGPYSVFSPERAKHLAQNWWRVYSEDYPNLTKEQFFAQIGITDAIAENYDDEENDSSDAVQAAIIRRIINSHSDLLSQYGPEAITNASRDVAEWVGKVEEIGSSDVSAWVKEVINMCSHNDEIEFERDRDEPDQDVGSDMQFDQDRDEDLPQWAEWPTKNSEMDESKMSDMDIDVSDLTDQEFLEKYNHTKQQAIDGDWENHYEPETMPEPTDESIGDDYVNKDEKMKRMGAKPLSTLDKVKIMPSQMKAMAKGDDEGDLTAYNKQFNEEIAQMRKIAGIGK